MQVQSAQESIYAAAMSDEAASIGGPNKPAVAISLSMIAQHVL